MVEASENFFFYRSLELVEVGDTRWVSHHRAALTLIAMLKTCLHAVQKLVEKENSDAIALKGLMSDSALLSLFLQATVCPILSQLSRSLQRNDLCWCEVIHLKKHYIRQLESVRDAPQDFVEYNNSFLKLTDAKPVGWGEEVDYTFFREFHRSFASP